jgi:hypothetical protein
MILDVAKSRPLVNRRHARHPIGAPIGGEPETIFNSLAVAMLLTATGSFLDAFSYLDHGHVFANVMTSAPKLITVGAFAIVLVVTPKNGEGHGGCPPPAGCWVLVTPQSRFRTIVGTVCRGSQGSAVFMLV